jgi:hypothetical protein
LIHVGRIFLAPACLALFLLTSACRAPAPATGGPVVEPVQPPEPHPDLVVVQPSKAVTNALQHVIYTFDLPRPPVHGYVIQESRDGREWSNLGRSTATNLTQVTVIDSTPNSGKLWRVALP